MFQNSANILILTAKRLLIYIKLGLLQVMIDLLVDY